MARWIYGLAALIAIGTLAAGEARGAAPERRSTLQEQQQVAVTIYNDDLALVRDQRLVELPAGETRLAFRDVSALIRPETALLRNLDVPQGFRVLEQNFDFDLLTPAKLLEKYLGRRVRVIRTDPRDGSETEQAAEVLAVQDGIVLKIGERIETGPPGRLAFDAVPGDLRDRPTLVVTLLSPRAAAQRLELAYLTAGLSWRADYVAELAAEGGRLDLSGWVTLTNRSGTSYREALLQLVAGDVHRVFDQGLPPGAMPLLAKAAAAGGPEMREEGLFEYHLYTLERPTTILENQTKQVALLGAGGVAARTLYRLEGGGQGYAYAASAPEPELRLGVARWLEFDNRAAAGLGLPLPRGVVRVYQQDAAGRPQFVGEDRIDHTPQNETVRLRLGDAFDLSATRRQTDFRRLAGGGRPGSVCESAHRLELRNAKAEGVTVQVDEPLPGDWEILQESLPHQKTSAASVRWNVAVPAGGSALLEYRVRVRD